MLHIFTEKWKFKKCIRMFWICFKHMCVRACVLVWIKYSSVENSWKAFQLDFQQRSWCWEPELQSKEIKFLIHLPRRSCLNYYHFYAYKCIRTLNKTVCCKLQGEWRENMRKNLVKQEEISPSKWNQTKKKQKFLFTINIRIN